MTSFYRDDVAAVISKLQTAHASRARPNQAQACHAQVRAFEASLVCRVYTAKLGPLTSISELVGLVGSPLRHPRVDHTVSSKFGNRSWGVNNREERENRIVLSHHIFHRTVYSTCYKPPGMHTISYL